MPVVIEKRADPTVVSDPLPAVVFKTPPLAATLTVLCAEVAGVLQSLRGADDVRGIGPTRAKSPELLSRSRQPPRSRMRL